MRDFPKPKIKKDAFFRRIDLSFIYFGKPMPKIRTNIPEIKKPPRVVSSGGFNEKLVKKLPNVRSFDPSNSQISNHATV